MSRVADYLFSIAVTLWVGALWAVGYISAPVLFRQLPDQLFAGSVAGKQFTIVAWLGIGCAVYILGYLFSREGMKALKSTSFWLVVLMLLLTLAGYFGIQPILTQLRAEAFPRQIMESVVRDRFYAWHGISNVLYLIESVLGIALVTQALQKR
jgi:hypothetical protein